MGDKHETKKLLVKKNSSVPRIFYSFNQVDANSEETNENQLAETASGSSGERAITVNSSDTIVLDRHDDTDADRGTRRFVLSPIPSPEVSRRQSLNLSILDENFLTNVQPIPYLTPSPRPASRTTEVNPDENHTYTVNDFPLDEEFAYLLETEANLAATAIASNCDADTEDECNVSESDRCKFSSSTSSTSSLQNLIIAESLIPKDSCPAYRLRNEHFNVSSATASVDYLDYKQRRVLSVSQGQVLEETTNDRSRNAADLRSSKFSRETRSTSDMVKSSSSKPTKNILSQAFPDFNKVEGRAQQYTKEKTALSSKPSIAQPADSLPIPPSRKDIFVRAVHPKSNSADNLRAHTTFRITKHVAKVSMGTQTTPQTEPVRRRISQLANSQYDPVTELLQDLRYKIDLTEKEKLAYQKAYEASEEEAQRLEAYIANGHQIIEGNLSPSCSLGLGDLIDAATKTLTPVRKTSSVSNGSGWITSSGSDDLLYHSPECEEVVAEVGNTAPFQSISSSSKTQKDRASSVNFSQDVNPAGPNAASSQPLIVMGVRHKIALAKNVTKRRKQSFQAQENDTVPEECFSPTASMGSNRNFDKTETGATIAIAPWEDLVQPVSRLPAQSEDDEEYPRHLGKIMWKAGFFLNKTATAIIPEVQDHLNLRSPKGFCALRKLTSKMCTGTKLSVGRSTVRSPMSSLASSQTSLSSRLRAKFRLPSITPKTRRRSKSVERFRVLDD